MDGGVVEIRGRRAPIEIDDEAGPPRAWVAFLLTLFAGAATLLFIVLTVLPEREAAARPFSITGSTVPEVQAVLREDVAGRTAESTAPAHPRLTR